MQKKKMRMCILLAVLLAGILILTSCSEVPAMAEVIPEDRVTVGEVRETLGSLRIKEEDLGSDCPMLFSGGRLYISAERVALQKELDLQRMEAEGRDEAFLLWGEQMYYRVNELARVYDLWPVFEENGISFFFYEAEGMPGPALDGTMPAVNLADLTAKGSASPGREFACLRLEDITADPSPEGRFTHEKLEKIRVLGRWMSDREQEYSVAWIPLFNDPGRDGANDLTKDFNFSNADFIYTLDYLKDHGGHIGLHGLTHQERDTASGVGTEFGKNSPFSDEEVRERLLYAQEIARVLNYEPEFFEFPHYAMTKVQADIAEELFPVIYQQLLPREPAGRLEWSERNGKKVLYVPTPADYVWSCEDKQGILERIRSLEDGQLISLFFHPSVDYDRISCDTDEAGVRVLFYSPEGILPAIFEEVRGKGLNFEIPWKQ